jgi:signal transduction histidine kinase
LERLAGIVDNLGEDNNQHANRPSGVAEIDAIDSALRRASTRLHTLITRERAFSAQASHQLRTPMTRLQLDLERGLDKGGEALEEAARSAMETAVQLAATIDDVLDLARGSATPEHFDVEALLEDCRDRWQGPLAESGRPLRVQVHGDVHAEASLAAARQVMHVLMDNAAKHGQGTVTLQARESHGAAAIDVIDEGAAAPISIDADKRIGLSLARSLLLAEGGRLLVDQRGPGTRFTALWPRAQAPLEGDN